MFGTKILEERKSKFNGNVRVVRTWGMGTYITSQGLTQSGGIVETIWRSTLSQIRHTTYDIRNVLILGLGGGTVAKLVNKIWLDVKITGVDIDPTMIELGKKYLGLDKIKIDTHIQDASKIPVCRHISFPECYDLIIVDLYNGDKFPAKFATNNYIRLVRTNLTSKGIVVFNRLYYKDRKQGHKRKEAEEFEVKLKKVFGDNNVERFYPTANVMFICRALT